MLTNTFTLALAIIAGSVMICPAAGDCTVLSPCNRGGDRCTSKKPCGIWEGDCDYDSQCKGDLVCVADKTTGKRRGGGVPDFCQPKGLARCTKNTPCYLAHNYCTEEKPCGAYQGDCDKDSQCAGDLVCKQNHGSTNGKSNPDFCQPKGSAVPKGYVAKFTKGFKNCKSYEYDTGRCTACPGIAYQSCPRKTEEIYGMKTTFTGAPNGEKYCGFLGCKMKCKVTFQDYGCGCGRPSPVDGWCMDAKESSWDFKGDSVVVGWKRRRAEDSSVLGGLLAEIEQETGEDGEGEDQKMMVNLDDLMPGQEMGK